MLLDGRRGATPARHALAAPSQALAEAIAGEWDAQGEHIDPLNMPLTRLANSIIDGVVDAPVAVAAEIEKYLASDLLLYRAPGPPGLIAREAQAWDPLLDWAREALGARFVPAAGISFAPQPASALAAARAAMPRDPWRLGALNAITTLTGSALIALAVAAGRLTAEEAWAAAHVDEDWNMDFWGRDEPELARRALRFAEMKAAAMVLDLRRLIGDPAPPEMAGVSSWLRRRVSCSAAPPMAGKGENPMKVTLDLTRLLEQGKINQAEFDKLRALAAHETGSLAFNILIGFGVAAVSVGAVALVPQPLTAAVVGAAVLAFGMVLVLARSEQWSLLAQICLIAGALIFAGGIIAIDGGSLRALLLVTVVFTVAPPLRRAAAS